MELIAKTQITDLEQDIKDTIASLDLEKKSLQLSQLQAQSLDKDFWSDTNNAKKVMSEIDNLREEIDTAKDLEENAKILRELFNQASEQEQLSLINDYQSLKERFEKFQILKFLNGKYDRGDAILSIHSGQGGTEANDWVEMLLRMYTRYCERNNYKYEIIHYVPGTEVGISTVTLSISGVFAFGKLKRESGVHRLIRLSPFNAQNLRQTSFAGVEVVPVISENDTDIVVKDEDIEFKAVRASGAGGQHVNKTSSAVQITHIPTGITVHSSERRDQFQNRKAAMAILKAKLWQIEEEKRENELKNIKGEHKIAGWGNQIRNYVLHPYKLVKDLRTGVESSNPENVLDGDLDIFVDAQVRLK